MKLILINNTSYNDIRVEFDSREHFLKSGENVFENAPDDLQLKVKIHDKSKVYFWSMILLNIIFFDFMLGDEVGTANLMCNSEYTISVTGDECVIELCGISALAKNGISYNSVFLNTQAQIKTTVHSMNDIESAKKSFVKKNIFFLVLLAILVILISFLDLKIALVISLLSLFFTIPCITRIAKAKKIISDEQANLLLNEQIAQEIENRKNPPKSIVDAVSRVFFKKRKK